MNFISTEIIFYHSGLGFSSLFISYMKLTDKHLKFSKTSILKFAWFFDLIFVVFLFIFPLRFSPDARDNIDYLLSIVLYWIVSNILLHFVLILLIIFKKNILK